MNTKKRRTIAVILCSFGLPGCEKTLPTQTPLPTDPPTVQAATTEVQLTSVVPADFVDEVEVPITIDGYERTDLMSRVEGYLSEVLVNIGDQVHRGQVLARLDLPEMDAELHRKEKLVDQAIANLASERSEVVRAEAQRAKQQYLKQLRNIELNRARKLVDSGAWKEDRLDEAQYAFDSVLASIQQIEADVEAARTHVRSAEAAVDVARAELKTSVAMMSYVEIRAPFDGVITSRNVDTGAFVRPPSSGAGAVPLFTIESVDRLRGVVMLPIQNASQLQDGVSVDLRRMRGVPQDRLRQLRGLEGKPLGISRHAGAFHRGSRMMRSEIDILNPADPSTGQRLLKPGDYGKVAIQLRSFQQVPSVPISAIGSDTDGSFVMRVGEGRICRRIPVHVLISDKEQVGLQAENIDETALSNDIVLESGDQVVSRGLDRVRHGEPLPE